MARVVAVVDGQEIEQKQRDWATRKRAGSDFFLSFDGLPNIDPILKCLNKDTEVYEQVLSDTRVRAAVRQRKAKITGMEWEIKGVNTPEAQIKILTALFESLKMRDIISQALNAAGFGYQVFEINWGMVGGLVLPIELVAKPNHWFRYDEKNVLKFRGINGQLANLPKNKFIIVRNDATYEQPYGTGYLSTCFWPVTFRKNGWAAWSIFMEKYGMPLPIVTAEVGATTQDIQDVVDAVAEAVLDAVICVPSNFKVEMGTAASGGDSIQSKLIDAANTDIAIAVLGTNLTMEIKGGSLAAAQVSESVAEDQIESDEKMVEGFFNDLLGMIYAINFNPSECPSLDLFPQEDVEKERSERDKNILDSNREFKFNKSYYIKNYKLQEEDFDIIPSTANDDTGGESNE